MDTKRTTHNLPIHKHPLFPSTMFRLVECGGCHVEETIYGGYVCNEPYCNAWFHKECAEAPPEINHHPSHLEHPLLLTNDSQSGPCDICGKELWSLGYTCPTCKFKVDLICGMKPWAPAIEHPVCHDHSLVFLKKQDVKISCEACKQYIGGPSYSCLECHMYFHLDCVHLSKEINHPCHSGHPLNCVHLSKEINLPCHSGHPLKVLEDLYAGHPLKFLEDLYAGMSCHFCEDRPEMMYHCSDCDFTMCFGCTKHPPPLVVDDTKTHEHPITLFSSEISFTCESCGFHGYDTKPYICLKCNYFVHGNCIGLPRVININRHDHCISFTHHLGRLGTKCGVCRKNVSQYYGAYFCSVCPNYTVHSRCAVRSSIWNGVELEKIPERTEDIAPFKVVGHNLISHFSHSEHTLKLLKDYNFIDRDDKWLIRCEACISQVGFGPIYACGECPFALHEKCANLPMKKRLIFDPELYTLECDNEKLIRCKPCGMFCDGFNYRLQEEKSTMKYGSVDVHCGSLSMPFVHYAHSHPLYVVQAHIDSHCDACKRVPDDYILTCETCSTFSLCLFCASLPEKIRHMSDEHPLTLSCVGNASDQTWCDVCESELDPSKWFYTCSDCEVALHVQCVLGDFSRLMSEYLYTFGEREYQVVLNNRNTRPFCSHCYTRCKVPVILQDSGKDNGYICSLSCLSSCLGIEVE